jgi:ActR/RegA family two-component response regulator
MREKRSNLLVEDDIVDQMTVRRFVTKQQLNYDLSVAGSFAEAMAKLNGATPRPARIECVQGNTWTVCRGI